MVQSVRTLLVDNYDSFTYNLVELLTAVNGVRPTVVPNDAPWESIDFSAYDNVVISPGPGTPTEPSDFGIGARVIAEAGLPVLGVCLGHQGLCALFGADIVRAPQPVHGRLSPIVHTGHDLFRGLPSPMNVVRYHSLVAVDLPDVLEVLASTADGLVMAVRHRSRPLWGVQFHPESISSEYGKELFANFRDLTAPSAVEPHTQCGEREQLPPPRGHQPCFAVEYRRIDRYPDPEQLFHALFGSGSGTFWLDGSAQPEPGSRFTIMGDCSGPHAEYITYDVDASIVRISRKSLPDEQIAGSLFDYLDAQLRLRAVEPDRTLPFDFNLGYVGYLGYELKGETGGVRAHRSGHPDAALIFADRAVVIDHDQRCVYVMSLSTAPNDERSNAWFETATAAIESRDAAVDPVCPPAVSERPTGAEFQLRNSEAEYQSLIGECLELISAGETYEVCLTNRATVEFGVDAPRIFTNIKRLHPVPHAALLSFPELSVVSASPERFLRVGADRTVESKPIKGTRPRGATADEDDTLLRALARSEKDRAENLMIVDLVRNDLSKVCEQGTVHVPILFGIETFTSVHQMVSTVRGSLRRDATVVDAIRALFPAGSMTGAPKIRTMGIIDELEGTARGVYSGAIGYLSLSGTADLSVAIRTMVVTDTHVHFGVGGAITALSDPAEEYEEILVKAASSCKVLGVEDRQSVGILV
ncbi:aminodeoxychorismate synthase component I [Rhodococcus koreensis]|uniref:aminodeoxychorismate synthase n=1 Tax=Rhodococcus koreensis TaxID=99653 RepID=A0A1H4WMF6_9NOCA|nr:aminodeoxychorismate synthase component I [Rhodococcus koreensis]SEC94435.1 para-aminobenzoate synthetase [Rhodococcus koreensis]